LCVRLSTDECAQTQVYSILKRTLDKLALVGSITVDPKVGEMGSMSLVFYIYFTRTTSALVVYCQVVF